MASDFSESLIYSTELRKLIIVLPDIQKTLKKILLVYTIANYYEILTTRNNRSHAILAFLILLLSTFRSLFVKQDSFKNLNIAVHTMQNFYSWLTNYQPKNVTFYI